MPYATFAPIHYEERYAYPLLVWLHDSASNEQELRQVMPLVSMRNYVAIAPRGTCERDSHQRPIRLAANERCHRIGPNRASPIASQPPRHRFNIHPERIFLVGRGSGGTMALRTAWNDPDQFAGVVAINGPLPSRLSPLRRVNELRRCALLADDFARSARHTQPTTFATTCDCSTSPAARSPCANTHGRRWLTNIMLSDLNRWLMELVCGGNA